MKQMNRIRYTEEHHKFMAEYVPGHHYDEIAKAFNEKFGPEVTITLRQVKNYIPDHNLKTGFTGRFEKGMKAYNKGMKITDYMSDEAIEKSKATRFKKNRVPHNYVPVGTEVFSPDGYVKVKIAEHRWVLKARYVWEQHNGPIPKGSVILHRDQNKSNDDISNLVLVTRAEMQIINRMSLTLDSLELNNAAINVGKILGKIKELEER